MQVWPKTFVHDSTMYLITVTFYVYLHQGADVPTDGRLFHKQNFLST